MIKPLALASLLAGLATAQSEHIFNLLQYGNCGDPNSSACYQIYRGTIPMPYVSSTLNDDGTGYPQVQATWGPDFASCFSPSVPISFHTGNTVPMVPTPQVGTCTGSFDWSDGGANSGTLVVTLTCRFDTSVPPYEYAISCGGNDGMGNSVTLIHKVALSGPRRFGYWNWVDHHGTMDFVISY